MRPRSGVKFSSEPSKMIRFVERERIFAIVFAFLIAIEIFLISSIPGGSASSGGFNVAIIYHIISFFLLNFFLIAAIVGRKKIKIRHLLIALSISAFYAVIDEIHQMYVPFRSASVGDVMIDSVGILFSTIVYFYSKR